MKSIQLVFLFVGLCALFFTGCLGVETGPRDNSLIECPNGIQNPGFDTTGSIFGPSGADTPLGSVGTLWVIDSPNLKFPHDMYLATSPSSYGAYDLRVGMDNPGGTIENSQYTVDPAGTVRQTNRCAYEYISAGVSAPAGISIVPCKECGTPQRYHLRLRIDSVSSRDYVISPNYTNWPADPKRGDLVLAPLFPCSEIYTGMKQAIKCSGMTMAYDFYLSADGHFTMTDGTNSATYTKSQVR